MSMADQEVAISGPSTVLQDGNSIIVWLRDDCNGRQRKDIWNIGAKKGNETMELFRSLEDRSTNSLWSSRFRLGRSPEQHGSVYQHNAILDTIFASGLIVLSETRLDIAGHLCMSELSKYRVTIA